MKRLPNYSLFTVNTASSQSQSTAEWPKLKVNVRREHAAIKDFWQASEPAAQEEIRAVNVPHIFLLFQGLTELPVYCYNVERLHRNHNRCCGKHMAAAHSAQRTLIASVVTMQRASEAAIHAEGVDCRHVCRESCSSVHSEEIITKLLPHLKTTTQVLPLLVSHS